MNGSNEAAGATGEAEEYVDGATSSAEESEDVEEPTPNATWSRLLAGNERFVSGKAVHPHQDAHTRSALAAGQHPRAAVLSCSDSREVPELIFDQGFGDMFTIRTAGQMLDDAVVASLEYAVEHLGVCLIVVLGHENCGAVASAVEELDALSAGLERGMEVEERYEELDRLIGQSSSIIVRSVGASVQQAREAELEESADFERVHIARTIEELVDRSRVVAQALGAGRVSIVGARYLLTSGKVEVLSF